MGQGTVGVDRDPQQLETEIAELRDELGALVAELDRRWHEALDIRLQLRRHAWPVAAVGVGVAITGASLIWLGSWRARRRRPLTARASRLRDGLARMVEPERVAADQTVSGKLVTAAATAAVGMAARKAVEYLVRRLVGWDHRGPVSERRSEQPPLKAA